jgi:hypothetical protein
VLWLKRERERERESEEGGGNNAKFFRRIANFNRSCNSIEKLVINGVTSSNSSDIRSI